MVGGDVVGEDFLDITFVAHGVGLLLGCTSIPAIVPASALRPGGGQAGRRAAAAVTPADSRTHVLCGHSDERRGRSFSGADGVARLEGESAVGVRRDPVEFVVQRHERFP